MGKSEEDTSAKTPKSSPKQSTPNGTPTVFPDWASFQAYYNSAGTTAIPAPAFYPSPVASSPQGHPYMWAPQHIMPPYGTPPPPYVAMYPPGALYPHPTIPPGSFPYSPYAMTSPTRTNDAPAGAAGGPVVDGKHNETKASGASANGVASQSGESGSEASSEGSDANSQNGMHLKQCDEKNVASGEKNVDTAASEAGGVSQATQSPVVSNHISPVVTIPPTAITAPSTTLNIGMDYWSGPSPASVNSFRSKLPITPCPATVVSARDALPSDLSLQDERELKRQKRKQSNRESARRSRLRKQAECEELAHRAGCLKEENDGLREELARIREECEKLASENASLIERLKKFQAQESRTHDVRHQPESNSRVNNISDKRNTSS